MQNPKLTRWLAATLISLSFLASPCAASGSTGQLNGLSPDDEIAIKTTIEAYRTAWLANDAKSVLKTLTDDAVLLPAHGAPAVVGLEAIEKYWFTPGGPLTTITGLDLTIDEAGGNRTLAFARGLDSVAWTVTENGVTRRHSHSGTYLNVMKKRPDGSWRIEVHMWDDGPERVE
jgi:uncharacterized protein (TIGR02246 family)